jgi:hypothetical protein
VERQAEPLEMGEHPPPEVDQQLLPDPPGAHDEDPVQHGVHAGRHDDAADDDVERPVVAGAHRRDAVVDGQPDQPWPGHRRDVRRHDGHEQPQRLPPVRPQQHPQEAPRPRAEERRHLAGDVVAVLGGDAPPVLRRRAHEAAARSSAVADSTAA